MSLTAAVLLAGCGTTVLVVDTTPPGAHVTDHRLGYLGVSPLRRTLSSDDLQKSRDDIDGPSTLRLTITRTGYEERVEAVSVTTGDAARVIVTLAPTSASPQR